MSHFLLKTEPSTYFIDDLKRDKKTAWTSVRNYQARNIIRDDMKKGDLCIIYHSSCKVPAAVGIGEVVREAYPDPFQFDSKSEYFDAGSPAATPRWLCVDIAFKEKFQRPITLTHMRTVKALANMRLLALGNRLSVFSITKQHFDTIQTIAE